MVHFLSYDFVKLTKLKSEQLYFYSSHLGYNLYCIEIPLSVGK